MDLWLVALSTGYQFEPRAKSVTIAKIILALSFLLPYLFDYRSPETFDSLMIYAPIWVLQRRGNLVVAGLTPMALVMFQFWLPYVLIGYQAYRYANGRFSSERSYLRSVIILTFVAILLMLPMLFNPIGSLEDNVPIYSLILPIPIIPVLALLSVRLLRPTKIEVPWTEESESVESILDEESVWPD